MDRILGSVVLGFLLDLLFGDPHWLYHPVRLVGKLISGAEAILRKTVKSQDPSGKSVQGEHLRGGDLPGIDLPGIELQRTDFSETEFSDIQKKEKIAGILLVLVVVAITTIVSVSMVHLFYHWNSTAGFLIESIFCYFIFATKSLRDESMKVYDKLQKKDLQGARYAVSMIVGRDTEKLDEAGVTKAAVETVAENTSDGVIAPMMYMMIGGPVLGWIYKAINTMDSMVGYKNEKYLYFGWCAAKLDDIVNFIPARISAGMMIAACTITGMDWKNAWRIFQRDRYNHASPNSAQTEAVMAGALHVQLAGNAWYFGKLYKKKTIGDDDRPVEPEDIVRANRLLYAAAALSLVAFAAVRIGVVVLFLLFKRGGNV